MLFTLFSTLDKGIVNGHDQTREKTGIKGISKADIIDIRNDTGKIPEDSDLQVSQQAPEQLSLIVSDDIHFPITTVYGKQAIGGTFSFQSGKFLSFCENMILCFPRGKKALEGEQFIPEDIKDVILRIQKTVVTADLVDHVSVFIQNLIRICPHEQMLFHFEFHFHQPLQFFAIMTYDNYKGWEGKRLSLFVR
jgi:hypothetical protein